jgi:hypothetical protein
MVKVFKSGRMGPSMRASGKTTRPMAKADSFMPMEMPMMGSGLITNLMVMVFTFTKMEQNTKVSGKRTSNTDQVD